jgi:hypothetical protein
MAKSKLELKIYSREWTRKKMLDPVWAKKRLLIGYEWKKKNTLKYNTMRRANRLKLTKEQKLHESHMASKRRNAKRLEVITHYGGKCSCCGETEYGFLTIDHVNGGGTKHRKEVTASRLPYVIIKNNFPKDYQVLCYNCNCARAVSHNKVCPHKKNDL